MKFRSLLLTAPRCLTWEERDIPALQSHEILIQTQFGAISIGSEVPLYTGLARRTTPLTYPLMTGYESLGVILACGTAVNQLLPGDRVVAFYGHRTHWVTDAAQVLVVPSAISDAHALLAILTCDMAKGIRKLAPTPEQPTLITGAGAIGLLTLAMLRAYGVQAVDVVEKLPQRHRLAYQLGASHVWTPTEFAQKKQHYAIGFECSSSNDAFQLLQEHMEQGGRICIVADGNLESMSLATTFHERELIIIGSSDGWDYHAHAAWYFTWVQQTGMPLASIFDDYIAAEALPATFARLVTQSPRPLKVMVEYHPRQ